MSKLSNPKQITDENHTTFLALPFSDVFRLMHLYPVQNQYVSTFLTGHRWTLVETST